MEKIKYQKLRNFILQFFWGGEIIKKVDDSKHGEMRNTHINLAAKTHAKYHVRDKYLDRCKILKWILVK